MVDPATVASLTGSPVPVDDQPTLPRQPTGDAQPTLPAQGSPWQPTYYTNNGPLAPTGEPVGPYANQPNQPYYAYPATGEQPLAVIPNVPYAPGQPAYNYAPPPPPKPKGSPKSTLGTALLNLTGLGLGYAYLRNRILLIITLVLTGTLITVGFLTDAADQPGLWRGLLLGWLIVLSLHGAFLASRREPGPKERKPVIAGIIAVVVVGAGYAGYGIAGASVYDSGLDAQAGGDCATATGKFDTVTGPFELTLSSNVTDAAAKTTECGAYQKAQGAQQRKQYEAAITLYNDFGKIYPGSVLAKYVHKNLADTHFARATTWKPPLTPVDARVSVDTLLMLQREFNDTDVAKKAPKAIADVFAEATKPYAEGKYCDSLTVLEYFAGLDASSAGAKVVADATAYRAKSLYECGLVRVRSNELFPAIEVLNQFLEAYPQDGAVPQAKAALIAAKVELEVKAEVPFPPPLGGNDPGTIPVTFYNDSNTPLTILVAGPTAHEITLPACGLCPESYPVHDDPAACQDMAGRPAVTLHLTPAPYYFTTEDPGLTSEASGSVTPLVGYEHWQCVYMVSF